MASTERVVLITGASSGIGSATAHLFAPSSSQLLLVGRDLSRLEAVATPLEATPILADITRLDEVKQVAATVRQKVDRLDVLINCAGQLEVGPTDRLGIEVTERLMRVNFLGAVAMIDACLPLLRAAHCPVIVNVSSLAGRLALPYMAAYVASKFALTGYSHSLRQELHPEGIHVGLVLAGYADTPMVQGKLGGQYYPYLLGVPMLTSDQVARAVAVVVERRLPEVIIPRRAGMGARLASAFPRLFDYFYAYMKTTQG